MNKPDDFLLAIVEVDFDDERATGREPLYIKKPFQQEPDFSAVSVNYALKELLKSSLKG